MAIDTLVAGRYSGTYNAVDVGITQAGYELQQDSSAQILNQSDAYGETIIDIIYRGGSVHIQWESMAYKAGSYTPFWPWGGGTLGVARNAANPIGILGTDEALSFVLTATASTPAAAAPATLTASKSILAPNYPARLLYDSRLRTVPVRILCLPTDSAGTLTWFTST
jgi:hypothetical protein